MPINYFNSENGVVGFSEKDYQTQPHAHFSIESAFPLSGSLNIKTISREYSNVQAAIIGSNVLHTFSCEGSECQLYFIDPTGTIGEQLLKDYQMESKDLLVLDATLADNLKAKINSIVSDSDQLSLHAKNRDDRIQECLDWIEENSTAAGIHIAMLSDELFLSESRLAHLFKEQIGISLHQYILWKKIEMTVKKYREGYSLTECAHFSGFTDSSHFNKTFKKCLALIHPLP